MTSPPESREAAIEEYVRAFRVIASPAFPFDEEWRRSVAAAAYDRDPDPSDECASCSPS